MRVVRDLLLFALLVVGALALTGAISWSPEPMSDSEAIALWTRLRCDAPRDTIDVVIDGADCRIIHRASSSGRVNNLCQTYQVVHIDAYSDGIRYFQLTGTRLGLDCTFIVTINPEAGRVEELVAPICPDGFMVSGPLGYREYHIPRGLRQLFSGIRFTGFATAGVQL